MVHVRMHGAQARPSRRRFLRGAASMAGAAMLRPAIIRAQQSVVSNPPREWGRDAAPTIYPDPDIIVVDPSFNDLMLGITAIRRLWTGFKWAEGPAWSSQGRYLVFSDVQDNTQYRYIWDNEEVTVFRRPSFNSNGNSFDFQGRQLSAQHYYRRVVRWEHDGSMAVIADSFEGKHLNSPNDLVPHPDGSIWFTDPPYGDRLSEGHPDSAGGPTNPKGAFNPKLGAEDPGALETKRELPTNAYRWDPSGRLEIVVREDQLRDPNGICFSPDYKRLYIASTGKGPGDTGSGGNGAIYVFDVQGTRLANQHMFTDMMVDGVHCGPDGMRADVTGHLWCSSNAPLGSAGVLVFNPQGKLVGRIRLPEVAANVAFGGPKRDRLFITASQSLYVLQVQTQGAGPG
ncbi:MAG TPA: SMP-30/gluconolactonase/LRE family protein [Acidobacteriota bacterium]|nr:SMP-30/gluconolactonase/LRE family protein [Acidobacteriota bacterium]